VGIDFGAALTVALAYIADRLGIFQALADGGALTSEQLASRTGLNERYIREWLATMAAANYVDYAAGAHAFSLNPAQRTVLLDQRSPLNMAGGFQYAIACIRQLPALTEAFRHGGGVRFADFGEEISDAIRRMFQPGYEQWVAAEWIPALPEIHQRLRTGGEAAEVGCGSGQCLIPVARSFPNSRFVGYDLDPASLARARKRIDEEGIANRVRCEQVAAEAIPERDYFDLVMAFNCIHDMANPRGALHAICQALKPEGAMLWSEAKASDRLEDNLNSWGRSMYGASTMHCMTVSLATGGEGLGSVIGPGLARELAREAGFTRFAALPVDNQFHQIFVLRK
ncbi:MAG: class I SAM-dependent methyltransferase, partial [Candidatus Binataceae bacterium]